MLTDAVQDPIFKLAGKSADKLGKEAYVVGGYVRDYIMGRECTDLDFVCMGSGIEWAEELASQLEGKPQVNFFRNFGTAHIKYKDWELEFVGARKESYRKDSRKPLVEEGSLEDDQNRRDLTINAMAICLNKDRYAELLDPFGGLRDIENKCIRTPLDPDITFSDDPLRMMRAIRFATQLDFEIEPETLDGIKRNHQRISIVSMERISDEINKIILCKKPSKGFKLLFNTGLLDLIFPELTALQGVEEKDGIKHKDNFYHTLSVLDNVCALSDNLWLRWAAIMHDIAKPRTKRFEKGTGWTFHGHEDRGARMVKPIFRRLRLPLNEHMKYVSKLVKLHLRPIVLSKEIVTDSAVRRLIFDAGDDIWDLLKLCRSDITSKNESKVRRFLKNLDSVEDKIKDVEERDRIRNWQPPIDGNQIMQLFDIKAGREIGILKTSLKEAILDGEVQNNYEDALSFVIRKGIELGLSPVKQS
jgi:poly(A) polymerase